MKDRDGLLVTLINNHYKELLDELESIRDNYEEYCNNSIVRKAIWLDVMQIGENVNQLTDQFAKKMNLNDLKGIISIRNFIVHGYVYTDKDVIWNTIHEDLPKLIRKINK